jgi:hypothetical protein
MILFIGILLSLTSMTSSASASYGLFGHNTEKKGGAIGSASFFALLTFGLYKWGLSIGSDLIDLWIITMIVGALIGFIGRRF